MLNLEIGGRGIIYGIGGGTSEGNISYMKELINKEKPRIAILNSSRNDGATVYNDYYFGDLEFSSLEEYFTSRGFDPVFIPLAIDNAKHIANQPSLAELIKTCDGVFFQGGDQFKHIRALIKDDGRDTLIMQAIREVYNRGGLVAGTSAGAHILSNYVIGWGTSTEVLKRNELEKYGIIDIPTLGSIKPKSPDNGLITPGIGLLPSNAIIDTHFDARGRLGRLLVALRDSGSEIGIGIDEATVLIIKDNIGRVVGQHGVFIIDARGGRYSGAGEGTAFEARNMVLNYLTEGDGFDFIKREVIVAKNKSLLLEESSISIDIPNNLFGKYETTKAIIYFANSIDQVRLINTNLDDLTLTFILEKQFTSKFFVSTSDENSYFDDVLKGMKKTTIVGLKLALVESEGLKGQQSYLGIKQAAASINE